MRLPTLKSNAMLLRVATAATVLSVAYAITPSEAHSAPEGHSLASQHGSLGPLLALLPGFHLRLLQPSPDFDDTSERLLSPDGRWIVYDHEHDDPEGAGPISLRALCRRGRPTRDLTFGRFNRCGPAEWSTEPDRFLFLTNGREGHEVQGTRMEIWQANVQTGSFRRPKFPWLPPNQVPVMSPSGREYLVIRGMLGSQPGLVYLVNAHTGQRRRLTRGDRASWSPDGRQVLVSRSFASSQGDSVDFYAIGADWDGCKPVILDLQLRDLAAINGLRRIKINPRPAWVGSGEAVLIG